MVSKTLLHIVKVNVELIIHKQAEPRGGVQGHGSTMGRSTANGWHDQGNKVRNKTHGGE